MKFKYPQSVFG